MSRQALVVGSTGIVGFNLAEHLVNRGWEVHGLARCPVDIIGVHSIAADLLDRPALEKSLNGVRPTHVFFATWSRNPTEAENIAVNGAMMRNLLDVIRPKKSVAHSSTRFSTHESSQKDQQQRTSVVVTFAPSPKADVTNKVVSERSITSVNGRYWDEGNAVGLLQSRESKHLLSNTATDPERCSLSAVHR